MYILPLLYHLPYPGSQTVGVITVIKFILGRHYISLTDQCRAKKKNAFSLYDLHIDGRALSQEFLCGGS
mgnify:CR=1 FL=1